MNKEEKILEISKVIKPRLGFTEIMIGDVLDYIDCECFRNKTQIDGMYNIDIKTREQTVITLYNHYIMRFKDNLENQTPECIDFVYNLLNNK